MNPMTQDFAVSAPWIVPVEPAGVVLEDHAVVVRAGRIAAVLPRRQAPAELPRVDLPGHALIPGLVNAHTHAAMALMRGLADDLPLMTWLNEHIWPAEARHVSPEFVHEGVQHACAEMIRAGVTCFNDMYFFPGASARAARAAGMRHIAGLIVIEFPSAYASSAQEYIEKGLALHDELRDDPLISTAFAPHAPYTVGDATLAHVRTLADELDIPVHMHVHETHDEIEGSLKAHGLRPLERLRRLGLLNPALLAVHMTQLTGEEIAQVAEAGASVAHCPQSNLKLASGFCPVQRLLDAGVNVALGTDGAASNNDLDLLDEMRTAALLAKAVAQDAAALPAHQALRMATLGGARALGLGEVTGSLTPGKWADIAALDLSGLSTQPLYHPLSQIVYAASRQQVSHVWVAGRALLHDGRLTTLDETEILARARRWQALLSPQA